MCKAQTSESSQKHLAEMKSGMSNFKYNVIHTSKFKFRSFPSLGDMTTQRYPSHEGNESPNSDIYPRKTG